MVKTSEVRAWKRWFYPVTVARTSEVWVGAPVEFALKRPAPQKTSKDLVDAVLSPVLRNELRAKKSAKCAEACSAT